MLRRSRLLLCLAVLGCSDDVTLVDGGEAAESDAHADSSDAEPSTTGSPDEDASDDASEDESGELELECGQCSNPWTHVGDLEVTPAIVQGIAPCLVAVEGDLTIEDIYGPEYLTAFNHLQQVSGGVRIHATGLQDLESFACLSAAARVVISQNTQLEQLHGLERLTSVNGLSIESNPSLTSLEGLASAITVTDPLGGLTIHDCDALPDLNGLARLSANFYAVSLLDNDALGDLTGLEGLFTGVTATRLHVASNHAMTSLAGLEGLLEVSSLYLEDLPALASLDPLAGLEAVAETLKLGELPFEDLSGLDSLTHVGHLWINENAALERLDGLPALTTVDGVYISRNPALSDFWGIMPAAAGASTITLNDDDALLGLDELAGFTSLGDLTVRECDGISSLSGLASAQSLGQLTLFNNASLVSLSGLEQVVALGGLAITTQPAITSLQPLAQLASLGDLTLDYTGITSLAPLANLTTLDGVLLRYNASLTSLTGLESVQTIAGGLTIVDNELLADLHALGQLSSVGGAMTLRSNPALADLGGLEQLTTVGGPLELGGCGVFSNGIGDYWAVAVGTPAIPSLAGLTALEHVGGLLIAGNDAMLSLDGAPNLATVGDEGVGIHDNAMLPPAVALAFVDELAVAGEISICDDDDDLCNWCTWGMQPQ